ncbi:TadE/TadG family type IV pilus assembly protein [Mesorhizobium sp. LjRoot246]|uniref:TadE/TadG family type IV pilus assembly protein n=1 Tax=Mesorhizobium sp. LjRoot246 TaxID=3342294 RepID=UPI003ECFDCB3
MRGLAGRFIESRSGSFAPILILTMIPLVTAIGFSVDYTSAVQTRSDMQAALDAAILSITTMDTASTLPQRQVALQNSFAANGAPVGAAATLNSFDSTTAGDGTAVAQASASYAMPTVFMQIARITTVPVAVTSSVRKTPALVAATFNVDHVSGYWNKTMTLYGLPFGSTSTTPATAMMKANYTYKPYSYSYTGGGGKTYTAGEPKGYGTTTISTVSGTTETVVQSQVCTTVGSTTDFTPTAGVYRSTAVAKSGKTNGSTIYFKTTCATTNSDGNSSGAEINVSTMDHLYLQMDVPSGPVNPLRSDYADTSNRLYLGAGYSTAAQKALDPSKYLPVEVDSNTDVDIFKAVPCGETSDQAWEDGGNNPPLPDVTNADFFYSVMGRCAFNRRPSDSLLTQ